MSHTQTTRPTFCTDEYLEYLDDLRESGVTNMFGAAPYLEEDFPELKDGHTRPGSSPAAQAILSYWMKTFGNSTR